MRVARNGVTRIVFLTGRYAVKMPRLRYGWAMFLRGLLSNMQEAKFTCLADQFALCPTIAAVGGGWLNIQPECQPLTDGDWEKIEHMWQPGSSDWNGFSCDFKRDNFGVLNGKIVLLDCGDLT